MKLNLETFNIILFRGIQRHTTWSIILDYKREKHIFETLHFSILKHTASTLQTQHSKLQQPSTTVIKLLGYIFFPYI